MRESMNEHMHVLISIRITMHAGSDLRNRAQQIGPYLVVTCSPIYMHVCYVTICGKVFMSSLHSYHKVIVLELAKVTVNMDASTAVP